MKTIITLALAGAALIGFTSEAEAGGSWHFRVGPSWGYHHSGYGVHSGYGGHCAPRVYKVRTVEVCRRHECRTAYHPCGRPYRYNVTVVTYRDIFSNGSCRTYTRVFS